MRKNQDHQGQGGPTTEAGRKKMEEAEAVREEKNERRRLKNKKKRQTYRERRREKTGRAHDSSFGGRGWYKSDHRPNANGRPEAPKTTRTTTIPNYSDDPSQNEEWESRMDRAVSRADFELMMRLFGVAFKGQAEPKHRYRKLSIRWHPDKNGGTEDAKIAFQALNEVFEKVRE